MATRKAIKNILITGVPGIGKTTIIKKLADALNDLHPAGFYTLEIREGGVRKGFELVSLEGRKGILSHERIRSTHRVGKYGVDVKEFDVFLSYIPFFSEETGLIVIDEIGKMESLSNKFTALVREILGSEKPVIATIALKGGGIISEIKKRSDVQVFEISRENRDELTPEILRSVRSKK